jgi:2,4-dienoyl-CoA reductase-like NADH-dependent reductase (Old Yellow Enzyme family)
MLPASKLGANSGVRGTAYLAPIRRSSAANNPRNWARPIANPRSDRDRAGIGTYDSCVALFEPLTLRDVQIRNRVWMSPMCQYSADRSGPMIGTPTGWHLQHYGSRAAGGAGLVMVEATAVTPEGRISASDLGLWQDSQGAAFQPLTRMISELGAVPAVQLAHAGRKAGTARPWDPERPVEPDWPRLAPSALAFPGMPAPQELDGPGIDRVVAAFADAATRALRAGFQVVEIHAAHGYLLHQFLSPVSNRRGDDFGGSFENRIRPLLRVVDAVRAVWPSGLPVFLRLSATDWLSPDTEDPRVGWSLEETVRLAVLLAEHGVDLVDVSSGGTVPDAPIPVKPGYQTPLSSRIRRTGIVTAAVGLITDPQQAEATIAEGQADAVMLGRALLRDAAWPIRAARALGVPAPVPEQYQRAF